MVTSASSFTWMQDDEAVSKYSHMQAHHMLSRKLEPWVNRYQRPSESRTEDENLTHKLDSDDSDSSAIQNLSHSSWNYDSSIMIKIEMQYGWTEQKQSSIQSLYCNLQNSVFTIYFSRLLERWAWFLVEKLVTPIISASSQEWWADFYLQLCIFLIKCVGDMFHRTCTK